MPLCFAADELTAVNSVHISHHKNASTMFLMLSWDEPSQNSRPDYYLVGVNQRQLNVTAPMADVAVTYNDSINITIRYSYCLELSPAAMFNLSLLLEGIWMQWWLGC